MRLRYVNQFRDRHGRVRYYFRRAGFKNIPLPGLPGSEAFMDAYQAALAGLEPTPKTGPSLKPGTVAAVVRSYLNSHAFGNYSGEFKRMRRNILERFASEHGDKRVALLTRRHVQAMLDAKSATPFAARNFLHSVRALMKHAVGEEIIAIDPTIDVKLVTPKTKGFRTWTEDDITKFEERHPVGSRARLALALLLYTGQRRSDVVHMGRQHIREDAIDVRQQKTGTELSIPIHPELRAVIDATEAGHLTFLVTKDGAPFSPAGFTNWFRECCKEARLSEGLSAHGLRKATCRRLAEAGMSAPVIMSISGHKSLREVQRYIDDAEQKKLARIGIDAMKVRPLIEPRTSSYKP